MTRRLTLIPILMAACMFYFAMPMQHDVEPRASSVISSIPIPTLINTPIPWQLIDKAGSAWSGGPQTFGPDGNPVACKDLPEAQGGVLLGQIVPCITYTVGMSTTTFTAKIISWMMPIFYAYLTLVICLFGVRILQGEQHIHVPAFVLILKITLVIGVMNLIPNYIVPETYLIMEEGVGYASGALSPANNDLGPDNLSCENSLVLDKYGGERTPQIWKQADCLLGKLYGFAVGHQPGSTKKTTNMLLASSVFGLLTGFLFGGTLGVAVFFAFIGVLVSIAMLILRVVMTFLNGYLTVCVMLIIAPLFMPLVFLKVTSDYFEKWWKAILGGMLLPVVVASYTAIALLAYDAILFAPNSLMQNLFNDKAIQKAIENPRKLCDMGISGNSQFELNEFQKQKMGLNSEPVNPNTNPTANNILMKAMLDNPFTKGVLSPLLAASNDGCNMFKGSQFDVTKIMSDPSMATLISDSKDPKFSDKKSTMYKFFIQAVKIFIMSFLINAGLKEVEVTFASFAAGSSIGATLMRAGAVTTNIQQAFGKLQQNMQQGFRGDVVRDKDGKVMRDEYGRPRYQYGPGGAKGADFAKAVPGAVRDSVANTMGGFLGGVNRDTK